MNHAFLKHGAADFHDRLIQLDKHIFRLAIQLKRSTLNDNAVFHLRMQYFSPLIIQYQYRVKLR